MSKPTILQLLHGMSVGGAEVLADRLARRLCDQYRFVFLCLDHLGELGENLKADGFPISVLGRREGFDLRCARRLSRQLKAEGVDLIHAHQYTPFFYSLTAGLVGRRRPILFTEHGRFHPDYPRKKRMLFNKMFLKRRDRVVAVGEAVRKALNDNEGIAAERVQVIYNGIDLSRFEIDDPAVRPRLRQELNLADDDFVAVLVGRLDYLKDHLTAVRTAERVVRQIPNFKLLLVGEGEERTAIEREVAERNVSHCVRLLGTRRDVPELLNASDVCLLTSISEGIPLTLIEGMAASLPVVATDVGGVAEVVIEGQTGLLAPAKDDAALAASIIQLHGDAELCSRLGSSGRERARAVFAEEAMHDQYVTHFEEMTRSAARSRASRKVAALTSAD